MLVKKVTQVDLGSYFRLPNPGLRAYLSRVKTGNDVDYRTPLWDGRPREEVIEKWLSIFESLDVDSKMPGLAAFELEQMRKIGPLSIMKPLHERVHDVEEYYKGISLKSQPIDDRAIKAFNRTLVATRGITLRSQPKVVASMRLSTNSGNPYFGKRRRYIDETIPLNLEASGHIYTQNLVSGSWPCIAVLGWRGQEGGPERDDVKQRVVWMFPFGANVAELQFYQPAIEAWQKCQINSAYVSMRAVEVKITNLFNTKGDEYVVCTDFSKFDQHFNKDLQNGAYASAQYMGASEEWLTDVFPLKYKIPILCAEDLVYTGDHGMASGSGGTNWDECCAHAQMQHEVAILHGKSLNPFSNAYGDDGYLSYPGIDVDDVISAYSSHGQVMNPDKQWVDKHSAIYLRRYFHDSYRDKDGIMLGVYSTFRALGRLLGQERFYDPDVWNARMVELRNLSILENCANSPIFEEFVDFVMKGDKFRLGLDLPGFLDGLTREVKKANELIPDFLGYTKTLQGDVGTGINNWRVVRYLRSKQ